MTLRLRVVQPPYESSPPSPGGVLLAGHSPREAVGSMTNERDTSIAFGIMILFGVVMIAVAGAFAADFARGVSAFRRLPPSFSAVVALVLAANGALLVLVHVRKLRNIARARRLRATYAGEPWRWDYAWDERGTGDDPGAHAIGPFITAMGLLVMFLPIHLGFLGPLTPTDGFHALVVYPVVIGCLIRVCYLVIRRIKYGSGIALFERFPFRRGSTLELQIEAPRALAHDTVLHATLRCVQERYQPTGRGQAINFFEVYRDTARAEVVMAEGGRRAFRVRFDIPPDAPTTDFVSHPHRYWEVDVDGRTKGVDYAARFLVPVY